MEPTTFQAAVQLAQQGNRQQAYHLLCQVLHADPHYAPAWLWMSGVVDDPLRQRECLERTLELDPYCMHAQHGLAILRQRTSLSGPRRLGVYLIKYGFLTDEQLAEALAEQQRSRVAPLLGTILLQRGWVTPAGLATVLMLQQQEALTGPYARPPQRLGEYLVVAGHLAVEHLAAALAQQMQLHRHGRHVQLGALLVRGGLVTSAAVEAALAQQRGRVHQQAA